MNYKKTSWFTLVELLIAMFISIIILSSMAFIFRSLTGNFTTVRYISHVYEELDNFTDDYDALRVASPVLLASTGGVFVWSPYGFTSLAFTNSGGTAWFLLTGVDMVSRKAVYGSGGLYSNIVPGVLTLTGGDITSIGTDFWAFLSGLDLTRTKLYTALPIIKLNYLPLTTSTIGKLELAITPSYYDAFQGVAFSTATIDPVFEYYPFSYLR